MRIASLVLAVASIMAIGVPTDAHHSYAGSYILEQNAIIEGTIYQIEIRNPHSFLNIEVKDTNGKISRWGAEWGGITELASGGIDKLTFKVGDKVNIVGAPSRDPSEQKLLMRKIVRPADGISWGDQPGQVLKNSMPTN